jgi:DNA polymerase-3 subunit delta'
VMPELPGQPRAQALLAAALAEPAHAYLLHGPPGTGKGEAARLFAAALLGCDARRIAPGSHPDLVMIEPEGEALLVDQVHELAATLRYRPQEAVRRVAIVDEADRLNRDAANAFLKTLEEPAGDVVMLLVADDPARVLPTVRSRCQAVAFPPLPTAAIGERLVEAGVDAAVATRIARRARGDLAVARRLAADADALAALEALEQRVAEAVRGSLEDEDAAVRATLAGVRAAGDRAEAEAEAETAALVERLDRLPPSRELDRERRRLETAGKATAGRRRRRAETDMMRAVIATAQLVLRDVLCVQAGAPDRVASSVDPAVLAELAERTPRARVERAIRAVDDVRRSLGQPVSASLALAAVLARVAGVRDAEGVPA